MVPLAKGWVRASRVGTRKERPKNYCGNFTNYPKAKSKVFYCTMEFHSVLLIIVAATLATASTVVELTNGNWDKITKRKAIFVKFCTKSCHHCKSMHIAWERLGDAWVDDEVSSILFVFAYTDE